jgi:cold-inducible RNA-binding protein
MCCSLATSFTLTPPSRIEMRRSIYESHLLSQQLRQTATATTSSTQLASDVSKQALYGVQEALPESYVKCSKCQTVYAIAETDLDVGDKAGGRRLECSVCGHSWFQSIDRLMKVQDDYAMEPLPERDLTRIKKNIDEGKPPKFLGDKKLYIGNVSFECTEEDLYEIFSAVGDVGDISFVRDEIGRSRGFGFVTMRNEDEGMAAVEKLDGILVRGRNIAVRESNS